MKGSLVPAAAVAGVGLSVGLLPSVGVGGDAGFLFSIGGQFPMDAFLAHWWVFPASILFAAIALSSAVSGALFFSPFFILVVGLPRPRPSVQAC